MPEALLDPRGLAPRARASALALLVAVLCAAAAGQAHFIAADASQGVQYDVVPWQRNAGLLWYGLAAVGAVVLCRRTRAWRLPAWPSPRSTRLCLIAIVGLGGALRFLGLAELPPGLWIDEALNGVQAIAIAERGRPLVALPPEDPRSGLGAGFVNLAALPFALADPDDGPLTLRAVAAVIGTVGVAAVACLASLLYGPRAAIATATWLAVSHWHLNYSRWGEMPILSPLMESLVVLGVALGLSGGGNRRRQAGFLLAGLAAGAGIYTYQTFRLWILLAAVVALVCAIWWRAQLAALVRPLLAAAVLAVAVAGPMLHFAATQPSEFGARASETLILGRDDWRQQLADSVPRSLLAFQLMGDDIARHNLPFAPLLSWVPAMLAPLGLAVCIARWRNASYALLPVWFGITLLPGILTLEAPHASRLLDAIVPLGLMIGVAIDLFLAVAMAAAPGRRAAVLIGATALGLAVLTVRQEYRTYFIERPQRIEFVDAFAPWESAPARYLDLFAPNAVVFLEPQTFWNAATRFVARRFLAAPDSDVRLLRLQHDFPPAEALPRDALYLLPRSYAPFADVIRAMTPDARCETMLDPLGRVMLAACRIPAASMQALQARHAERSLRWPYGLRGRFHESADGTVAEAILAFPYLDYPIDQAPLGRFQRAEWEGFIDIPSAGDYRFRLHPDSTTLAIAGRIVIADAGARRYGGGSEGAATLPAGRLPIRITLDPGDTGRYFLWFFWQPPGEDAAIVPPSVLHPPEQQSQPLRLER